MENEIFDAMNRGLKKAKEVAKETGESLEDILFTIGKEGEEQAESIKDLNDRGEIMPFVCMSSKFPTPILNCHRMHCDGCNTEVWMSPATKIMFDKADKKIILCLECLSKQIPQEQNGNI